MAGDDIGALRRRRRLDALLIGAALAALALAIASQGWLWRAERVLYDLGLALSPRAVPADIVIVAIDDASIAAIGRWPWRRAVHTTLLERIAAARPRAVMLDLVLSEPDPDPRQDALLAQALRNGAPLVLPLAWYHLPGEAPRLLDPAPLLRDAARLAQAEVVADDDGIVRHTFLRAGLGRAEWPHAALALLDAGGQAPPRGVALRAEPAPPDGADTFAAWRRDQRLPIRFQGPPGHLRRVSYVDVLRGAVPAAALAGKYVLVGMTAVGLGDAHATPMGGAQGQMKGIEVIGQTLQALRRGDTLREPGPWATGAVSALVALLMLGLFVRLSHRMALGLSLVVALGAAGFSVLAVRWGWWVTPAGVIPAALLAYPLWSWRRFDALADALDREITRLDAAEVASAQTTVAGTPRRIGSLSRRLGAITEATARVRQAQRYLSASLNGLPQAVLLADAQGRVALANQRAADLFEAGEAAELTGLSLARLLSELGGGAEADWAPRLQAVAEQGSALAVQVQSAGQGDFLVRVAASPETLGPRLIATCADIGLLKAAEREREEVLAFVTHDLRSPLASIALLSDLHRRGLHPLPLDESMGEIAHLARRALDLSEAFVRAGQAESKPLERVEGDLALLLVEALREVAPQAQARGVRLELVQAASRVTARFDRELLARAVGNLLGNAIKFSPAQGRVLAGLQERGAGHVLSVQDQGPGMQPEQLATLFQAYSRAGATHAQAGVGLGLQFVQRVADRHGGWVRVDSTPGQGTRFELFVPAA